MTKTSGEAGAALPGHEVTTVPRYGWAGVKNGQLLRRAAREFDAFITLDRNLVFQQNLIGLDIGIIVVRGSSKPAPVIALADQILARLAELRPGSVIEVGPS